MKNHKNRPRTMKNQPGWLQETPRRKWWFFVTDRHCIIIYISSSPIFTLPPPDCLCGRDGAPKLARGPCPGYFPITFLFLFFILYFLHYALVALSHHHGLHVHNITKVATKKTFVTWQKSNKASAVFSGVSLTGSATFSTFDSRDDGDGEGRVEICRDRHDRQPCKILASCVIFSGKNVFFLHNLRRCPKFTHAKCDFTLKP